MIPATFLVVLLLAVFPNASSLTCNATHLSYVGKGPLGRSEELNLTFAKIQKEISTLPDVVITNDQGKLQAGLFNIQVSYQYVSSEQMIEVFTKGTIIKHGGVVNVTVNFDYFVESKKGPINDTASAFGVSNSVSFVKKFTTNKDRLLNYQLLDYLPITWYEEAFRMTNINENMTLDVYMTLRYMMNQMYNQPSLRSSLESKVNEIYVQKLTESLNYQKYFDNNFDYVWTTPGKPNATISFTRRAISVDYVAEGIRLLYQVQAVNSTNWTCGSNNVADGINWGSNVELSDAHFYENVVRQAISMKLLDSNLTKQNWQSDMFHFQARDLFDVFDNLEDKFQPTDPISGYCKAATDRGFFVRRGLYQQFEANITFDCNIEIQNQHIVDFSVNLHFYPRAWARQTKIDFSAQSWRDSKYLLTIDYNDDYPVKSDQIAREKLESTLLNLNKSPLFGSGWPLGPPRFSVSNQWQYNSLQIWDWDAFYSPAASLNLEKEEALK